jgi:hypothetical protein
VNHEPPPGGAGVHEDDPFRRPHPPGIPGQTRTDVAGFDGVARLGAVPGAHLSGWTGDIVAALILARRSD